MAELRQAPGFITIPLRSRKSQIAHYMGINGNGQFDLRRSMFDELESW